MTSERRELALTARLSLAIAAGLAAGAMTLLVALVPALHFAYRRPELHVALEVAASLIGLLAAYLVFGRLRRSGQLTDLALACALTLFAVSNLAFAATPAAFTDRGVPGTSGTWAAASATLLGAIGLAAAGLAPSRRLRSPGRATAIGLSCVLVVLVGLGLGFGLSAESLPTGVEPRALASTGRPDLDAHIAVLAVQFASMMAFVVAAGGFARRAARRDDGLLGWLALGAMFAAYARLNYFLYPSLYSQWVYSGDAFRLLFYAALLVGLTREIGLYWRTQSEAAVLEERRRIARDLHDGLAQELAFIARKSRQTLLAETDRAQLGAAAERALDESRRAIAALTRPLDEPLDLILAQAAEEVAGRTATPLVLDLATGIATAPHVKEAIVRITCEAVSNAARHAAASRVLVELRDESGLCLRVADDGIGFDPAAVIDGGGFGLTSMRERAHALGADFALVSRRGQGTEVTVTLP